MRIERLQLQNFRSYESLDARFQAGVNILYGRNGQGKTNILEAIYLCTCARSHRTAQDSDLIRFGQSCYQVELDFYPQQVPTAYGESLCLSYDQGERRAKTKRCILHNGMELDRLADMMGLFHAVIFAPEDLQLLREGPGLRRRFLNLLLSQLDPLYFADLQKLLRILRQRNLLLKTENMDAKWMALMEIWDESYSEVASRIILKRRKVTEELAQMTRLFYQKLSGRQEECDLRYLCMGRKSLEETVREGGEKEIKAFLLQRLAETRREDAVRGSTSIGPHRDDVLFTLSGQPAKSLASQGQTRSIVLALKMAELAWMEAQTGEKPVFLLDDVMSELDAFRRRALIEAMEEVQVFVTCTEADQVDHFFQENQGLRERLSYYEVEASRLRPTGQV